MPEMKLAKPKCLLRLNWKQITTKMSTKFLGVNKHKLYTPLTINVNVSKK